MSGECLGVGCFLDDCRECADLPPRCVSCDEPLGGWCYVARYLDCQEWVWMEPICRWCRDELRGRLGDELVLSKRWRTAEY